MERKLNIVPSKRKQDDWTLRKAILKKEFKIPEVIPAAVDLREDWWKPGNQLLTGSCVGWSLADGVLRWHYVKNKKLNRDEKPSVRFIWMASKEMDEFSDNPTTFVDDAGTSLKTALDVARKFGCVKDNVLPFRNNALYEGKEQDIVDLAAKLKIKSYYNLMKQSIKHHRLEVFRMWLASNGPILTCLDVDKSWDNLGATGHLKTYRPYKNPGGHAVCIVGYTPDYFIIRNSWGKGWGDNGFAYASDKYMMKAFTEAYGVVMK